MHDAISRLSRGSISLIHSLRGPPHPVDYDVPKLYITGTKPSETCQSSTTTVRDVSNELPDQECIEHINRLTERVMVTTHNWYDKTHSHGPLRTTRKMHWAINTSIFTGRKTRRRTTNYVRKLQEVTASHRILRPTISPRRSRENFFQTVLAHQDWKYDCNFFEDYDRLLQRWNSYEREMLQVVVPKALKVRLLSLKHNPFIAGHPCQILMQKIPRRWYYSPHMAVEFSATVRSCHDWAKNAFGFRRDSFD